MPANIQYRSSRAKLDWCHSQLNVLAREIADLIEQQNDTPMFDKDPKSHGMFSIKNDILMEVPDIVSVQAGRIVGAIRSALDNLIVQTAEAIDSEADTRSIVFPISGNDEHPTADQWMTNKVGPLTEAYMAILRDLRPHKGGNADLFALHELRKQDEHLSINIIWMKRSARFAPFPFLGNINMVCPEGGEIVFYSPSGSEPNLNTTVSVCFGKGTSAEGREVVPTIGRFIQLAMDIVSRFERI